MDPSAQSSTDHDLLRQGLADEGLEFLGVAAVPDTAPSDRRQAYRSWLAQGRHGTMDFLERHEAGKYDPDFSLVGTRSVVVAALGYHQVRPDPGPGRALVARYAWGRDYHKVIKAKLDRAAGVFALRWPDQRWRTFTDTAPLDERYWSLRAGGSFTARNTLSIRRGLGSWFLLGEILTTQCFAPTLSQDHSHGSCPSSCRRCSDVCPTGALDGGKIDANLCISYLTIEHRGPISDGLKAQMGAWVFGCDLCQEVCPFNLGVAPTVEPEFLAWKAGPDLDPAELLVLDGPGFTARFGGSPVHRAGRAGLVRNACIAAANLERRDLVGLLEGLTCDPDAGVADAASWALGRLGARTTL